MRIACKFLQSNNLAEAAIVEVFLDLRANRLEVEDIEDFLFKTTKRITLARLREIGMTT
jgi:hypothetical protein